MNTSLSFSVADTYLSAEWQPSTLPPRRERMRACPFLTISRQAGTGGSTFATALARRLNALDPAGRLWRVYDENLLPHLLEENHLSPRIARFLPETRISEVRASIGELVGLHPNLWEVTQRMHRTVREMAQGGFVIFVGRGINFATLGLPFGTHVRLIAPEKYRAQQSAERHHLTEAHARSANRKCEAARARYVRSAFGADVADPLAYDLVLNLACMSQTDAVQLVIDRVSQLAPT